MPLPQLAVIVFMSAHDAIKAKNKLEKARIVHELIPTPKEISSECGMSLRIEKPLLNRALELFRTTDLRYRNDLL
ncbi:MAG: DUF3343 domain-containing protein [Desulfitobacteriaceae bacterium]|nr:DUF3343 domain-containing protein [Desulfitobacteriaceae bacterium]